MADHEPETVMEKISEKIHSHDSSSSSSDDSDDDKSSSIKNKVNRLFRREKPVHKLLGGGKPADVFLWKDKKMSAGVLGGSTVIWVLFEVLDYNLLTLICHVLILALLGSFLWSKANTFIKKSPAHIPEIIIPEKPVLQLASDLRITINRGFSALRDIASGRDLKLFLSVMVGLWIISILGSVCDFLSLIYIAVIVLHSVPVLYDKYEEQVDEFLEKALAEIKKQYAVFDAKVLSKIPRGPLKDKKKD